MPKFLFANNGSSTLASGITSTATSIFLNTGDGALFPSPAAGQQFPVTLKDSAGNLEIAYCTSRTGDTLTVTRGQESTTQRAFAAGDSIELRVTQGVLNSFMQSYDNIPSTTKMIFPQAAAPQGWTQDTTLNDKVLRVVNSAGAGTGGSWTISGISVDSHTLTSAEMPVHTHVASTSSDGSHRHNVAKRNSSGKTSDTFIQMTDLISTVSVVDPGTDMSNAGAHTHTITVNNAGSGGGHSHTMTIGSAWRPAYVDVIACSKD